MLTPQQEELSLIDNMIGNATFALQRAERTADPNQDYLRAIATSLIAIAKLMQLQAEQN